MATQLVPYNTAMKLGSGFNSFTQTLCVDNAVVRDIDPVGETKKIESEEKEVAQSVTYKTSIIEKTTDITDEMNIEPAFKIKYDQLQVDGKGSFINTNKIKSSDVNIMVSVKVVNQVIRDHSLTHFQPIPNIKDVSAQNLAQVYGDSFISGWQEGGEFLAVISITAKNRNEAQNMAADVKIAYTGNKDPPAEGNKNSKGLEIDVQGKLDKIRKNLASENEVSVSVTWTGGGQHLKDPQQDWDFDTMRNVALRFPDLCAKTPMRTHAVLTKYTALRSFYAAHTFELPVYDKTGIYTNVLQEAYLDYKAILGAIQVLAFDVSEGKKALVVNPRSAKAVEQLENVPDKDGKAEEEMLATGPSTGTDSEFDASTKHPSTATTPLLPAVEKLFAPTIAGLEEARLRCRHMMSRIIQEIDNITIRPEIATDEHRSSPCLSPFLFKLLLPLGMEIPAESSQAAQAVSAAKVNPDALAGTFTNMIPQ